MKITKTRLRQIIKEELDSLTGDEFSSSMGRFSDLQGGIADDSGEDPQQIVAQRVASLMDSELFVNADPQDKKVASAKIMKALLNLRRFGGRDSYYEEILDDALGTRSALKSRLARAAGMDPYDWGDKLAYKALELIR